jgi:glutamine synthetase
MAEASRPAADIVAAADAASVSLVRLQFTDILGVVKNVAIPATSLAAALAGQVLFDGSAVEGFVRSEEADVYLLPDPDTFALDPPAGDGVRTARLVCDIVNPDRSPYAGCPRSALKRVLAHGAGLGFQVRVAPEVEFFLFERDGEGRATIRTQDQGGYFDLSPGDRGEEVRRQAVLELLNMGFRVEASHHEVAPGQHEIDLAPADALVAADQLVTLRVVVREVARRYGCHATFIPKPVSGINGSGLHLHQYLDRGGDNALGADGVLSPVGRQYLAGLLHHAPGFTAVTNPLVNSYKRLVPGYEAPIYVVWSEANRSPLVRVVTAPPAQLHLELRSPDPSANPYLAWAATIRAGLDGVERQLVPPKPQARSAGGTWEHERERGAPVRLPDSLSRALEEFRRDLLMRDALGDRIWQRFLEAKRIEWDVYSEQVHAWELDQYLTVY